MNRIFITLAIVLALFTATAVARQDPPEAMTRQSAESFAQKLASPDANIRKVALRELRDYSGLRVPPTPDGRAALLKAATLDFALVSDEFDDPCRELIRAAGVGLKPGDTGAFQRAFPKLSDRGKLEMLYAIGELPDRASAQVWTELLLAADREGKLLSIPNSFERSPRHSELIIPAMLTLGERDKWTFSSLLTCLAYASAEVLSDEAAKRVEQLAIKAHSRLLPIATAKQKDPLGRWRWDEDYEQPRSEEGLALDVLGYGRSPEGKAALAAGLALIDPRLAAFAASSLIRRGQSIPEKEALRIARDAEGRGVLHRCLSKQNKLKSFPQEFLTQRALAEANMVDWLTYPTELGRAPDDIELMEVISDSAGPKLGTVEYYVYRFRTVEPDEMAKKGWMAGIAGPYYTKDGPTCWGAETFSEFSPWDKASAKAHADEIREKIRQARDKWNKEGK